MIEFSQDRKVAGRLAKLHSLSTTKQLSVYLLCAFLLSCSKTDANLDTYFSRLVTGKDQVDFPFKISNTDTVCVLQAYQNRVRSRSESPSVNTVNSQLDKADFRGTENTWVLARLSEGELSLYKIDRYNTPLTSPADSDYREWRTEAGKKSAECATGTQLKFSVFINQTTGERRVGLVSGSVVSPDGE